MLIKKGDVIRWTYSSRNKISFGVVRFEELYDCRINVEWLKYGLSMIIVWMYYGISMIP